MTPTARRNRVIFAGVIALLLITMGVIAHWEPLVGDTWGYALWHEKRELTWASYWAFLKGSYLGGNPRLGQVFMLLSSSDAPIHEILTPCVEMMVFLAMLVLAVGRWPRPGELADTGRLLIVIALCWLAVPRIGVVLFYRPFTTNYLYGFLFHLILAIPYRLHLTRPRPSFGHPLFAALMLVWGAAAGMTNEHTGPATIAALAGVLVVYRVRNIAWSSWMFTGLIGLVAGYLTLFLAPGQRHRYAGLAKEQSIVERILSRGVDGNLDLFRWFFGFAWPLLAVVAIAAAVYVIAPRLRARLGRRRADARPPGPGDRRARLIEIGFYLAAGLAMVATLLASPKQGPRLFFAPMVLFVIATVIALDLFTRERAVLWILGALAAALVLYQGVRVVSIYRVTHAEFRERVERLQAGAPGGVAYVEPYTYSGKSKWFFGDDFLGAPLRERIGERHFGLRRVELIDRDESWLLGQGAQVVFDHEFDPPVDGATRADLARDAPQMESRVDDLRAGLRRAVERLTAVPGHVLASASLRLRGLPLPRAGAPDVVLASWRAGGPGEPGELILRAAALGRRSSTATRTITLDAADWPGAAPHVYLVALRDRVAEATRDDGAPGLVYQYVPWRTGAYWIVACGQDLCHLLTEVRHKVKSR